MAIKISNLEQISKQLARADYVYKDLHLDFEKTGEYNTFLNTKLEGNDIKADFDEKAIINSLKNLFNTKPGQRFLFPTYGLDLNQFLFESVTTEYGQLIGEKIVSAIETFEPRVRIKKVNVIAMPDNNQYDVTIMINIPLFNTSTTINTTLDIKTQSFIFVKTSRNR